MTKPIASICRRVENATLNPEITRAQVRTLVKAAFAAEAIDARDVADLNRILADRTMCAEDALDELRSTLNQLA